MIERRIAEQLDHSSYSKPIWIYGPRRSGKTTLLSSVVNSESLNWINGAVFSYKGALELRTASDADTLLCASKTIVIDEILGIRDFEQKFKLLVERNRLKGWNRKIFVSTSSQPELNHCLAGLVDSLRLWPVSLQEYSSAYSWSELEESLGRLMIFGMLPGVVANPSEASDILIDYCKGSLYRDVLYSCSTRKPLKVEDLVYVLARHLGEEINYDTLAREVGISSSAAADYLNLLEKCFVIKVCPSFPDKANVGLKKGKKIYFVDNGVRNAVLRDFRPLSCRPDAEALLENFFFMERLKFNDYLGNQVQPYFWRAKTEGNMKKSGVDLLEVLNQNPIQGFKCTLSENPDVSRTEKRFAKYFQNCLLSTVTVENLPGYFRQS